LRYVIVRKEKYIQIGKLWNMECLRALCWVPCSS
jgi:hypothetical protein